MFYVKTICREEFKSVKTKTLLENNWTWKILCELWEAYIALVISRIPPLLSEIKE